MTTQSNDHKLVVALRTIANQYRRAFDDVAYASVMEESADMLEFFLDQMSVSSPKMNGEHSWRFRGGWPMTCAIGPTPEKAIVAAIKSVEEERRKMAKQ